MRGDLVLVRAFGGEPFVGRIYSEGERGARVARADADLDAPGVLAAGVAWEDIFKHDPRLAEQLSNAATNVDVTKRAGLWEKAKMFRSN